MEEIKKILKQCSEESNKVLEELMDLEDITISDTLLKSMKYSLFSGGKRLRPILTRLVAELVDGDIESALRIGAAIELIHTFSLIHDDLPSMDDDDYRRGKLTNHKVFGPGIAILAGDGLLAYSFNILSKVKLPPAKTLKIIDIISEGTGFNGMVGGQVLDLEAENKDISLSSLKKIHKAKTGALFKSSIMAGAYCGEPTKVELQSLQEYAKYLGLTFQIVDDILDVIGDEEMLEKKVGSDESQNKSTYPKLLGLDGAKEEAKKVAQKAKEALELFGDRADVLCDLIDYILVRQR